MLAVPQFDHRIADAPGRIIGPHCAAVGSVDGPENTVRISVGRKRQATSFVTLNDRGERQRGRLNRRAIEQKRLRLGVAAHDENELVRRPVPIHRALPNGVRGGRGEELLHDIGVAHAVVRKMAHMILVHQKVCAGFVQLNQQMRPGQQYGAAGSDVTIARTEHHRVIRRKPIHHLDAIGDAELEEGLSEVRPARVAVKSSVARDHIKKAIRIDRRRHAARPNGALGPGGRRQEHTRLLLQVRRVIPKQPPMVWRPVAVRTKRHIDYVAQQHQTRTIEMVAGIEGDARYGRLNHHRPVEFFLAAWQIERMETLEIISDSAAGHLGFGIQINDPIRQVNRGRARNSNLRRQIATVVDLALRHGSPQVHLPEWGGRCGIVRIECIHAVVLGGHKDHVINLI